MDFEERRAAARFTAPDRIDADVSGVKVDILDLSLVGLKVRHEERLTLVGPLLTMRWQGREVSATVRIVRSQIVGRNGERLVYNTALHVSDGQRDVEAFIASILLDPGAAPVPITPPAASAASPSLDDTWTRQIRFVQPELDEDLPYAEYRLTAAGWQKEYVASPVQPDEGFTIARDRADFHELQRTYEAADPDTRRMIQNALRAELQTAGR